MFDLRHTMTSDISTAVTTSVILMHLAVVRGTANLFYPDPSPAYQNRAYGTIRYNNSQYLPTCGWKLILSTNYPLCSISIWDATAERVDGYTYILTNVAYAADPTNRVSSVVLMGLYGNTWPTVILNWYCVCDKTTGGTCQSVTYETVASQNTASSPIPCPVVSTLAPTTTTTPSSTTTMTTRQTPSVPLLSLLNIQISSNPNGNRIALKKFGASCYTGPLYTPLLQIAHFIDCCSVCCSYTSCLGVNFLPASQECDLVFENVTATTSTLLNTMGDCTFWKVIYRS